VVFAIPDTVDETVTELALEVHKGASKQYMKDFRSVHGGKSHYIRTDPDHYNEFYRRIINKWKLYTSRGAKPMDALRTIANEEHRTERRIQQIIQYAHTI